jgi:hypothetical protein
MSKAEELANLFSESLFPGGDDIEWSHEAEKVKKQIYQEVLADLKSGELPLPDEGENDEHWLKQTLIGMLTK